jgi:hypothetical protein
LRGHAGNETCQHQSRAGGAGKRPGSEGCTHDVPSL